MNYPRQDFYIKAQNRSPKMAVKRPLNVRKKLLTGQSAHGGNRIPNKNINTKIVQPFNRLEYLHRDKNTLNEQQIKNSTIYKLLQQEIHLLANRQQLQISKLKEIRQNKNKEADTLKKQQYAIKLQMWELKNQAMQLKYSIKQEHEQTKRLAEQLGLDSQQQLNTHNDTSNQQQNQNINTDE